ncbi:hypothetical protein DFH27DRAFT_561876 [Peziza echinospora]|nr:hypothetical protein DFH27DRAFT_561876 [Peziza echinospora]
MLLLLLLLLLMLLWGVLIAMDPRPGRGVGEAVVAVVDVSAMRRRRVERAGSWRWSCMFVVCCCCGLVVMLFVSGKR